MGDAEQAAAKERLEQLAGLWRELVDQFRDEVGRMPTAEELAEVLAFAIRSVFVDPTISVRPAQGSTGSSTADVVRHLNDAVFVTATDLLDLARVQLSHARATPGPQEVVDLAELALEHFLTQVEGGLDGGSEPGWRVHQRAGYPSTPRIGDVFAVPIGRRTFRYVVVVARTSLGTALGILDVVGPLRVPEVLTALGPRPSYVGEEAMTDGRWQVALRGQEVPPSFDPAPEMYFVNDPALPDPSVGPFGSAERPTGETRDLSESEARELGLLDGSYRQTMLPEEFEAFVGAL